MPALATRFTEETAGPHDARTPSHGGADLVSARLQDEFLDVPVEVVDRCVEDVQACAAHLGVDVTTAVVERIAREHLLARATSAPLLAPPPTTARGHGV
ncbi:hypothetical protein ACFFWE_29050 [Sphaerisporangium melleum]|nr:hypothetical protein [Sphaerisporangium melleum]